MADGFPGRVTEVQDGPAPAPRPTGWCWKRHGRRHVPVPVDLPRAHRDRLAGDDTAGAGPVRGGRAHLGRGLVPGAGHDPGRPAADRESQGLREPDEPTTGPTRPSTPGTITGTGTPRPRAPTRTPRRRSSPTPGTTAPTPRAPTRAGCTATPPGTTRRTTGLPHKGGAFTMADTTDDEDEPQPEKPTRSRNRMRPRRPRTRRPAKPESLVVRKGPRGRPARLVLLLRPDAFDEFQDTGRGTRARCAQCNATMVKPYDGVQWQAGVRPTPPQNAPSRQGDSAPPSTTRAACTPRSTSPPPPRRATRSSPTRRRRAAAARVRVHRHLA